MKGIKINEHEMTIKEYNGKRVVTFKDVDMVHERPEGTANKRFYDNKRHFIEGEDYYKLSHFDSLISEKRVLEIPHRGLVVLTESGYLMLVKSFTDDLAWEVQRKLVKSYFRQDELALTKRVKQIVDIPVNHKIQTSITEVKKLMTALDVVIDEYGRCPDEDSYIHLKVSLSTIALKMFNRTCKLIEIKPGIAESC